MRQLLIVVDGVDGIKMLVVVRGGEPDVAIVIMRRGCGVVDSLAIGM